jgi:ribose-phosphate pyrophosphokinase
MNLIGEVADRTCVLVDDMVDTAGTLCKAAQALNEKGASKVVAYATHAVLSGAAIENISQSELELVVTNSIPLREDARKSTKIHVLPLGPLLAESIRRISNKESISAMFL